MENIAFNFDSYYCEAYKISLFTVFTKLKSSELRRPYSF